MKANASKHSAMSYARMKSQEPELAALVEAWLNEAQLSDEQEDDEHGPDRRGDEMPDHIKAKVKKLARIRASMARIEAQAKERAEKEQEQGRALGGTKPKALDGEPKDKDQSNFTDPDSRIMKTKDGYVQAYNCQAAVDAEHQVIVALSVNNEQNDYDELVPLLDQIKAHTGEYPEEVSGTRATARRRTWRTWTIAISRPTSPREGRSTARPPRRATRNRARARDARP